jgi:hypothetical protein
VAVRVDGASLHFYAPPPGDRWNTTDAYLLTLNSPSPSPRVASRTVAPLATAGTPSTARERGVWSKNRIYESLYPGTDGDHWFAATLLSRPSDSGQATALNSLTALIWNAEGLTPHQALPLAAGRATYTLTLAAYPADPLSSQPLYPLRAQTGSILLHTGALNVSPPEVRTDSTWRAAVTYSFAAAQPAPSLTITLLPASYPAGLKLDGIHFDRPVALDLQGRGALFHGAAGQTLYRWSNGPAALALDVTDPAAPVLLQGAGAHGFSDSLPERSYLVAGAGFAHTPAVAARRSTALPSGGQAIYIVPDDRFVAPLQPLVNLRRNQGYTVAVVDVRAVYERYGHGQVSPQAIRRFLQEAYGRWNPRPISVVLVGDGTWDVKNYSGKDRAPALIPPYLHGRVDSYLGEAPCERCYVQLNGSDPVTGDDPKGGTFDAELWIGRFPVKDTTELGAVVAKIVAYEMAPDDGSLWRSRSLFYADNYLKPLPDGSVRRDEAGDFARASDRIRSLEPVGRTEALAPRAYYDPFPALHTPPALNQPWRINDPNLVGPLVLDTMDAGVALAVYNGHASYFRIGATEAPSPNRGFILELNDERQLNNRSQPFVHLSMTCLTAQFAVPADSGTSIDEAFLLHPGGGAVAVWGSAGISVARGHEELQTGFFDLLAQRRGRSVRLGALLEAGYDRLLASSESQDALRTFLLLGDPLTPLRYRAGTGTWLPIIRR